MNILDNFLLVALPYVALIVFLIGSIYRYNVVSFKFSSLSSQFLVRKRLFFGSVPFHIGLLFLFFGHLTAFLIPKGVLAWNVHPARLLVLEITAFIFGLSTLIGLINLFIRRTTHPRLSVVTNKMDIVIEILLIFQVILGLWIANSFRWGSSWFAAVLSPYLYSIFTFQPDIAAIIAMPLLIKLHISGAFLIILLIPFSRLVHFLVAPLDYIWRPYQRVFWHWARKRIRNINTVWTLMRPKNN